MRASIDACAQAVSREPEALEAAILGTLAVREAAMLQALAEREDDLSAGHEVLVADRAALASEIGAMEAAARRQESHVRLNVGGARSSRLRARR